MITLENLLVLQISLLLALSAAANMPIAKPGCPDRCGNMTIPYPFGTQQGCYLNTVDDDSFLLTCNSTTNTLFMQRYFINYPVLSISLDGQFKISTAARYECYDKQGRNGSSNILEVELGSLLFTVSYSHNKFIAVGCNTYARLTGYLNPKKYTFRSGCSSICYSNYSIANGSCSGVGCCQLSIPKGTYTYFIGLESSDNHSNVLDFNPCSYAFVVEDGFYNFNSLDLAKLQTIETFPVAFDWIIGNNTCAEAKRNQTTYACKDKNSECLEFDEQYGYRCNCTVGFHGNPYLSNGCLDNDECADPSLNDCVSMSTCQNTEGNYTCICPKGYLGDGRRNGQSCIGNPVKSLQFGIFVGVGSGLGLLLLLLGSWLSYKLVKRRQTKMMKQKNFQRNGGLLLEQQLSSTESHVEQTKLFGSKELEIATDYYHVNRILGQGGQGTVYKGMLTDGRVVAIKKSKVVDEDKLDQFINEVVILSQINHRNVVKLFGCCLETEVPLLVYEFIPNGTLFELLHNRNEQDFSLTWQMRLQIATEVAGAIAYLHSSASMPIYHRDIKTSNILLDEKYRAKVADFGTSKSISIDETHVTTRVQGTFRYLDPEYFQLSQFTEKSDVYSFGVVLVELLTGQKPISMLRSIEGRSLAIYFLHTMEDNCLFEIVDDLVLKEGQKEEIIGMARLAKSCLKLNGRKRPNMKTVAMELERIRGSEGVYSFNESEYDEVDYEVGGYNGPWEITSSSTKSMHSSSLLLISEKSL